MAVPTTLQEQDFNTVRECFSPSIVVVPGSKVPVEDLAGPIDVQTVRECSHWLINLGPTHLWHLSALYLGTYFGKKMIDGFATEAGKDFWGGIKGIFQFVSNRLSKPAPPPYNVTLGASGIFADMVMGRWVRTVCDVTIDLNIPDDEEPLVKIIEDLERFIFPVIGCMCAKSDDSKVSLRIFITPTGETRGKTPVLSGEEGGSARNTAGAIAWSWLVHKAEPFPWKWTLWDLDGHVMFEADLLVRSFEIVSSSGDASRSNVPGCLNRLGLALSTTQS